MKVIKRISEYIDKKPLFSYVLVVTALYIFEFLNSLSSLFVIEVLLFIVALRAYVAFKIVKYLKAALETIEKKEDRVKINEGYKKYYKRAIISYTALVCVCSADAVASILSAICGFYAYLPYYFVVIALEYVFDVIGISCLFLAHLKSDFSFSKLDPSWIISNIAIALCALDAFNADKVKPLFGEDYTHLMAVLFFYVFLYVVCSLRMLYAFRVQDEIELIYNDNTEK